MILLIENILAVAFGSALDPEGSWERLESVTVETVHIFITAEFKPAHFRRIQISSPICLVNNGDLRCFHAASPKYIIKI